MDEETLARRVAQICGPHSAAAQALNLLDRRRAAGEAVVIVQHQKAWIVAPKTPVNSMPTQGR